MQKNKQKSHISKRTLKKVVFRSCPGLLLKTLIPVAPKKAHRRNTSEKWDESNNSNENLYRYKNMPR
jgi:hypothetical protein